MKNLEDEYKRFCQEETPDLWNRIEAGLTDKKAGHKKIIFPFRYFSVCAAAILLLGLLSGIWILGGRKASETVPKEDMALQNMVPEAAGGMAAGDTAADTNGFSNEAECSTEDGTEGSAERYEADAVQPEENADAMLEDASGAASSDNASLEAAETITPPAEESRDEQISGSAGENADGQMAGVMEVTEAKQKDGYTVYYLCTKDGEVVSAVFKEEFSAMLQTGESYLFSLKASEETAWDYVIEAAEAAPAE